MDMELNEERRGETGRGRQEKRREAQGRVGKRKKSPTVAPTLPSEKCSGESGPVPLLSHYRPRRRARNDNNFKVCHGGI